MTEPLPSRAGSRTGGLFIPASAFVIGGGLAALGASIVFVFSLKALMREVRASRSSAAEELDGARLPRV